MELTKKKCKPCEGGVPKLTTTEIKEYQQSLKEPWEVADEMKILKAFQFKDYAEVIGFVNKVAELAEEEGHHPVMQVFFSVVKVELWTHAILGLSENDFILAAKIDELY
jgi:4a-hydroxytetrahydrobiopterin dehydratase